MPPVAASAMRAGRLVNGAALLYGAVLAMALRDLDSLQIRQTLCPGGAFCEFVKDAKIALAAANGGFTAVPNPVVRNGMERGKGIWTPQNWLRMKAWQSASKCWNSFR